MENYVDGSAFRQMVIQAAYAIEARKKELNSIPTPVGEGTRLHPQKGT